MDKTTLFCVVTTARSGSTWLATLLDSHPSIKSLEEPFIWRSERPNWKEILPTYYDYVKSRRGMPVFSMFRYIDLMSELYVKGDVEAVGFKVMYSQMRQHPSMLLKLILRRFRLIHLVRTNYLDIVISRAAADQYSVLHSTHTSSNAREAIKGGVVIDVRHLLRTLARLRRNARIIRNTLQILPMPVLEVSYEGMIADRESVLRLVSNFLAVSFDVSVFESDLERLQDGSYRKKIANYSEVRHELEGTEFQYLLQ